MDAIDSWVTIANTLGAAVAAALNLWASHHAPPPWRRLRLCVGTLGLIIAAAFGSRFWFADQSAWASMMGGVSLLVWPIVWIWPAVLTLRTMRAVERIAGTFDL